jgi:hypothetical protein
MPMMDLNQGLLMTTRRDLLKAGMMAGIAAVFGAEAVEAALRPAAAAGPGLAVDTTARATLFRSTFLSLVDERFSAYGSAPSVALRLTAVRDLPQADRLGLVDSEDCFSLRFDGPLRRALGQGTYVMRHPSLDAFPLFLVPMGRRGRTWAYEAVINRPPQA